jgi:hypothetical protein
MRDRLLNLTLVVEVAVAECSRLVQVVFVWLVRAMQSHQTYPELSRISPMQKERLVKYQLRLKGHDFKSK